MISASQLPTPGPPLRERDGNTRFCRVCIPGLPADILEGGVDATEADVSGKGEATWFASLSSNRGWSTSTWAMVMMAVALDGRKQWTVLR